MKSGMVIIGCIMLICGIGLALFVYPTMNDYESSGGQLARTFNQEAQEEYQNIVLMFWGGSCCGLIGLILLIIGIAMGTKIQSQPQIIIQQYPQQSGYYQNQQTNPLPPPPSPPPQPPQPTSQPIPLPQPPQNLQQQPIQQSYPIQQQKQSKSKNMVIIVSIAIVCLVITSLVFLFIYNKDTDGDGYPDRNDLFPNNKNEWKDTDLDGVGDNGDTFPDNPNEWNDTDSDGIGNNADIFDDGNGGLKISITYYEGDGEGNDEAYDPYFIINIDTDGDDEYNIQEQSKIYENAKNLTNPFFIIYDSSENINEITFNIEVWDDDFWADDTLDYSPDSGDSTFDSKFVINKPFLNDWDYNGSDDGKEEQDCRLIFKIEVVEID